MTEKILQPSGNYFYKGTVMGFNYEIELKDDAEFKDWLKAKLDRYVFSSLEKEVIKEILGVKALEEAIKL